VFTAENCPYIVIGVPAFAPKSEASLGFALATRRIKNSSNAPYEVQDLTSALSRIESGEIGNQLTYAIPADFDLFLNPSQQLEDFSTEQLLEAATQQLAEEDRERVASLLLKAGLEELLKWNWGQADTLLKTCLRISSDERIRDEALNLVAACLVMNGDTPRAIQALSKAVEGQWNLRLQANLAILALEEDPKRAVEQMSYLIDGAVGPEEKVDAIRYAIGLWRQVQSDELGTEDVDDYEQLPDRLVASIMEALVSNGVKEEDFFDLGLFVARVAPRAITPAMLSKSKYYTKSIAKIVFARADGFSEYIENIVSIAYLDILRPRCVDEHIDSVVEQVVRGLFDGQKGSVLIAHSFLKQGLRTETMFRIWIRAALVMALPKIDSSEGTPNEDFYIWLLQAKKEQRNVVMPDELAEMTSKLLNDASDLLFAMHLRAFDATVHTVSGAANRVSQQMNGLFKRLSVDKNEVRKVSRTCSDWCDSQLKMLDEFEILGITNPELFSTLRTSRAMVRSIKAAISQYRDI
jgi:hypothetical protein